MGLVKDPSTGTAANVVDATNPTTTGKNALLVVDSGTSTKNVVLYDSNGNEITSTDEGGGIRALDVHIRGGSQSGPTATEGSAIGTSGTPIMGKDAQGNAEFLPIAEDGMTSPLKGFLIMGTDDSTLRAVKVRSSGAARTETIPYLYSIAEGVVPNHSLVLRNPHTTVPDTQRRLIVKGIWNEQSSGAQRSLVSDSAQDAPTGTGARKVLLSYISSLDGTRKQEVIALNGTTAVNTVATDIKWIDDMKVIDAGAGNFADGTISIMSSTAGSGSVVAQITPGENKLRAGVIYCPIGKTIHISRVTGTSNDKGYFEILVWRDYSSNGGSTSIPEIVMHHYYEKKVSDYDLPAPIRIDGGQKMEVYVTSLTAGAFVSGQFAGWEE